MKENFESNNIENHESAIQHEAPIVSATLKRCEKFDNRPEIIELVKIYVEEYLNEEIKNTKIFTSEKYGASFPYTVIRLSDIARNIYDKLGTLTFDKQDNIVEQSNMDTGIDENDNEDGSISGNYSKKELIFGTFFTIGVGHPYHWIEHGIDQITKKLPESLRRLSRGEKLDDVEIYGIGSPVGELGSVSDEFVKDSDKDPFGKLGELYTEFIQSLYKQSEVNQPDSDKRQVLDLWGVSMGASVVSETATNLLKDEGFTQSTKDSSEKHLPLVRPMMYMPVGAQKSKIMKWQIPIGFGVEALYSLVTNSYARDLSGSEQQRFVEDINIRLAENGINPNLSPKDIENKKKFINKSIDQLRSGIPVSDEIKTNEVIGMYDPLMYPVTPESDGNHRKFGIKMTHTPAVVRDNYFKRLVNMGGEMYKLSNDPV